MTEKQLIKMVCDGALLSAIEEQRAVPDPEAVMEGVERAIRLLKADIPSMARRCVDELEGSGEVSVDLSMRYALSEALFGGD